MYITHSYPLSPEGIDSYLFSVRMSAYRMLIKQPDSPLRVYDASVDAIRPLSWYVNTGRAPTPFIKTMLRIRPDVIARLLLKGGSDQEVIERIKTKVNQRMEVSA